MARGRKKKENLTLEEEMDLVIQQIEDTEENLKFLRQQKKEIEKKLKDAKKEELYEAVMSSGKSIDDVLAVLSETETETENEQY